MRSHDHRLALAAAMLLALTLLPAAISPSSTTITGDILPTESPTPDAGADPDPGPETPTDKLAAYRGLGTWIDIYDDTYEDPVAAVRRMHRKGAKTLYLETANFHRPANWRVSIYRPRKVAQVLREAHRREMHVVAWYLPSFQKLRRDYRRSMAAIRFRTHDGHRFDSFALDIEYDGVADVSVRNERLRRLSRRIDNAVDPAYPLGAIVPEAGALYWDNFPYKAVARRYDVFLPMAYYTFRTSGTQRVERFIRRNIEEIRAETGRKDMPVHAIGGLSADSTVAEVRAFVRAAEEKRSLGASLYSFPATTNRQWEVLARLN